MFGFWCLTIWVFGFFVIDIVFRFSMFRFFRLRVGDDGAFMVRGCVGEVRNSRDVELGVFFSLLLVTENS